MTPTDTCDHCGETILRDGCDTWIHASNSRMFCENIEGFTTVATPASLTYDDLAEIQDATTGELTNMYADARMYVAHSVKVRHNSAMIEAIYAEIVSRGYAGFDSDGYPFG